MNIHPIVPARGNCRPAFVVSHDNLVEEQIIKQFLYFWQCRKELKIEFNVLSSGGSATETNFQFGFSKAQPKQKNWLNLLYEMLPWSKHLKDRVKYLEAELDRERKAYNGMEKQRTHFLSESVKLQNIVNEFLTYAETCIGSTGRYVRGGIDLNEMVRLKKSINLFYYEHKYLKKNPSL